MRQKNSLYAMESRTSRLPFFGGSPSEHPRKKDVSGEYSGVVLRSELA